MAKIKKAPTNELMTDFMKATLDANRLRRKLFAIAILLLVCAAPSRAEEFLRWPSGNIYAEVSDLLFAAEEPILRQDIEAQRVELIGQFQSGRAPRFKLTRKFTVCCEEEVERIALWIESKDKASYKKDTWLRVVGIATFEEKHGKFTALLKAEKITLTPAPSPDEELIY